MRVVGICDCSPLGRLNHHALAPCIDGVCVWDIPGACRCVKLVPTPGDATAEASLSVLKQALLNRNMVGIARLVKRKNDAPQLGALLPAPDAQECALVRPVDLFFFLVLDAGWDCKSSR